MKIHIISEFNGSVYDIHGYYASKNIKIFLQLDSCLWQVISTYDKAYFALVEQPNLIDHPFIRLLGSDGQFYWIFECDIKKWRF